MACEEDSTKPSWLEVSALEEQVREWLDSPSKGQPSIAVALEKLLLALDPSAETLPGAQAWAIVAEAMGDQKAAITYLQKQVAYLESLAEMGLEKSGGIGPEEVAEAIEDLALALWDSDRNWEALVAFEQFRDIAKSANLAMFDADAEETLQRIRRDAALQPKPSDLKKHS